jgi:hypothetical protein
MLSGNAIVMEIPEVRGFILEIEDDTAIVQRKSISQTMHLQASVEGVTVGLSFNTNRVPFDTILVHVGQRVKEGDVVAVLDFEILDERIDDARKSIANALTNNEYNNRRREIQIEIAELQLSNARNNNAPHDSLAIMAYNIELQRMELIQQIATQNHWLERARRNLAEIEALYDDCYLYAPFDGIIVEIPRATVPGMWYDTRTVFMYITSESDFIIEIRQIYPFFTYQSKYITHGFINGQNFVLNRLTPTAAEIYARAARLRFVFQSQEDIIAAGRGLHNDIPLGAFVMLTILQEHVEDALVIPVNALYEDHALGAYVYVRRDGVKTFLPVEIGIRNSSEVQVISYDLREGEVIYVGNH